MKAVTLPFFLNTVPAGFPSPADDYLENTLDLNEFLIKKPAATFMVRVSGDSMIGAGIENDDLLIIDRSVPARDRSIVLAIVNGEFTVKRLYRRAGVIKLIPENKNYPIIDVTNLSDFEICGVVVHAIKSFQA